MLTLDKLREYGADVDEGLGRCMQNGDFYIKLVNMSLGDGNYDKLVNAVNENNLDAAFEAAHALKGVLGNLSLTPILEPVSKLTELLRARTEMDYAPCIAEITKKLEKLKALCD